MNHNFNRASTTNFSIFCVAQTTDPHKKYVQLHDLGACCPCGETCEHSRPEYKFDTPYLFGMMRRARSVVIALSALLAAVSLTERASAHRIINQDSPVCKGIFDFYFVLDRLATASAE